MIYQSLIDAGCDEELIKRCMSLYEDTNIDALKRTLSEHRQELLNQIFLINRQIDCLDQLQCLTD